MSFDDTVYFYARAVAWKYNHEGTLPNYGTVIALYNNDYSTETNAPTTTSTQPFTINTIYTKLSNGKYNLTLKPSTQCTIYYTRNGTTPNNTSKKYTGTIQIFNNTWIRYYGIDKNNQNISNDLIDEFVIDQSLDYVDSTMYTAFLNSCGLHET